MKHKLYIIAFYWPPAGGPGVQRWLKFVKYLSQEEYQITVVVPESADYASTDHSMIHEIPQSINILKVPIKEPSRWVKHFFNKKTKKLQRGFIDKQPGFLEKKLLWIRGNYFIPDARVGWVKRVVAMLDKDSAFAKANTLITTGPPHSVHLIGLELSGRTRYANMEWIADFRDPWTTIGYHKSLRLTTASQQKHENLEVKVLRSASKIITTSPSTAAEFREKTNTPVQVITNGYDLTPNEVKQPEGSFVISHVGTLLADRNPLLLWRCLTDLCDTHPDFAADFQLHLAGNISDTIKESIAAAGLEQQVHYKGYVSHDTAVQLINQSQVLLLIEIDTPETTAIIPGKTFEYMASRRPIIAIGPDGSDIETLLQQSGSGTYFNYQMQGLKNHLLNLYQAFKLGQLTGNPNDVSRYHRKNLTQQLSQLIKR